MMHGYPISFNKKQEQATHVHSSTHHRYQWDSESSILSVYRAPGSQKVFHEHCISILAHAKPKTAILSREKNQM